MITSSPLRYPGGKASMSGLLREVRRLNRLGELAVAEPFAGGAGAALTLLYLEETPQILINDADPAIHDFWWSILNRNKSFIELLSRVPLNISEWRRQRASYRSKRRISRVRRGFATFYLNRCNRSGIVMNGGPIGGIAQRGKWKLDARFNRMDLRKRCEKVAEYGDRIRVSQDDGIRFIERLEMGKTFFFIDPPYYEKGPSLYLNALEHEYHEALAATLRDRPQGAWILTYDDCPEIRRFYEGWAAVRPFQLRYTAAERRSGTELLIAPKWMKLPKDQPSLAMQW